MPSNEPARPFSLRLTREERAALEKAAEGMALGVYVRSLLFGDQALPRLSRQKTPIKDADALARVLGMLGSSDMASNLSTMAKAAKIGALPLTEETETDIRNACADIRFMREALLRALGLQDRGSS